MTLKKATGRLERPNTVSESQSSAPLLQRGTHTGTLPYFSLAFGSTKRQVPDLDLRSPPADPNNAYEEEDILVSLFLEGTFFRGPLSALL